MSDHTGISFPQNQKYDKATNRIAASRVLANSKNLGFLTESFSPADGNLIGISQPEGVEPFGGSNGGIAVFAQIRNNVAALTKGPGGQTTETGTAPLHTTESIDFAKVELRI